MFSRSQNVKRNILWSVVYKAFGVGLSFLLLPLTIHYMTTVEYGIWVTLFSVMSWVNFLDMGIGLGLRNKLAESVSRGNVSEIRMYMSTGFAAIGTIGLVVLLVFIMVLPYVSLQAVFNTTILTEVELYDATLWTGFFVIVTFVLSVINQIYYAYQKASITGAIQIMHNAIMLAVVLYLTYQPDHQLVYFVFSFGIATLSSRLVFICIFFYKHREVFPRWCYVRLSKMKDIVSLGFQFFIIQLAVLTLFSASNILITQRLGPDHVQAYDVAFKIFSVITMVHGLICAPLWNAYTDAYVKQDYRWMNSTVSKMTKLMFPIVVATATVCLLFDWLLEIWIRKPVDIPPLMIPAAAWFVLISCWNNIWAYFVNGIGKVQLQMWTAILSAVVIIPLAWYLMSLYDSAGMLMAMDIILTINGLPICIQVQRYLRKMRA